VPRPVPHVPHSAKAITQTTDPKEWTNRAEPPIAVASAEELARRLRTTHTIA
jgi:hypothetical protein